MLLLFYYFVSRLSPLPDAVFSQADEYEKVLELFTLQRRKKTRANESRAKFTWSMPNAAEFL